MTGIRHALNCVNGVIRFSYSVSENASDWSKVVIFKLTKASVVSFTLLRKLKIFTFESFWQIVGGSLSPSAKRE